MTARQKTPSKESSGGTEKLIAENRRARRAFEILEDFEAGIVLVGTEVKTLREGKVSLDEAFARIDGDELFLVKAFIEEYRFGNRQNHVPTRRRKLLMRRSQIRKLHARVTQKGLTLVPLALYFNERGLAKLKLGLAKGRKVHDKRQQEKEREARREIRSA